MFSEEFICQNDNLGSAPSAPLPEIDSPDGRMDGETHGEHMGPRKYLREIPERQNVCLTVCALLSTSDIVTRSPTRLVPKEIKMTRIRLSRDLDIKSG